MHDVKCLLFRGHSNFFRQLQRLYVSGLFFSSCVSTVLLWPFMTCPIFGKICIICNIWYVFTWRMKQNTTIITHDFMRPYFPFSTFLLQIRQIERSSCSLVLNVILSLFIIHHTSTQHKTEARSTQVSGGIGSEEASCLGTKKEPKTNENWYIESTILFKLLRVLSNR